MTYTHKHYDLAKQAHAGTSFSPEKRGEMYCKGFDADISKLKEKGVGDAQIAKYEALFVKHLQSKSRCLSPMITGGSNFPVARNDKANSAERKASESCLDYYNKIVKYAEQEAYYKANPHARPVMSGDGDAIERLKAKLEACVKSQEKMKSANKILRKKPFDMEALVSLMGEKVAEEVVKPSCFGDIGFASFELNNNRAEIKRLEGRIKEIETKKETGDKEIEINGIKIVQNSEDMRIQIFFDGKPDETIRKVLKSNAFKWAPSKGAWQRQLTNNAIYSFNHFVLPEFKKMGTA